MALKGKGSNDHLEGIFNTIIEDNRVVRCMCKIKDYDEYTYEHSCRVCGYALRIAVLFPFTDDELVELGTAALLHDYGKIKIDPAIINKPDQLTEAEYEEVKKHPVLGVSLLQPMGFSKVILRAIAEHHENSFGVGYPFGLWLDDISIFGRIIAVADIFDAVTVKRIYNNVALDKSAALDLLRREGRVDPEIIRVLELIE